MAFEGGDCAQSRRGRTQMRLWQPNANGCRLREVVALVMFVSIAVTWSIPNPLLATDHNIRKGNSDCPENENTTVVEGWIRPTTTYGHVHMAKTAGTTINGFLAAHFERVCGHKGYSYDAFQFNKRVNESEVKRSSRAGGKDLVSKKYNRFNRGRVPPEVMDRIGYEDCDYVSMEAQAHWWTRKFRDQSLELHVSCRDPVDHLISQCNYRRKSFDCSGNPQREIDNCLVSMGRFNRSLTRQPNINVKCFDFSNLSQYLEHMGTILQRRRVETDYIHRTTNHARHKEKECLWTSPALMDTVRRILVKNYDYYNFCEECIGSGDDLLHHWV